VLRGLVQHALKLGSQPRTANDTGRPSPAAGSVAARLLGQSPAMTELRTTLAKVARSQAPVYIAGESGVGKELVARTIHDEGARASGPFVPVNCGAIPAELMESEFFGHKKGSFTGAHADKTGLFQAAEGGTLFLDEIAELPMAMQVKLLRAIQERSVRSLGATQEEPVDVRIISATHKNLASEVLAGRFRQDLYYRLNVIEISIPPLRDRREDLPALCQALLQRIASESGLPVPTLSDSVLTQLARDPLTGNVRELENLLHRALALSEDHSLQIELAVRDPNPTPAIGINRQQRASDRQGEIPSDLQGHLDQQERRILIQALNETGFNRTAAAARLGLSLRQMRYRIARLNIETPHGSEPADDPI